MGRLQIMHIYFMYNYIYKCMYICIMYNYIYMCVYLLKRLKKNILSRNMWTTHNAYILYIYIYIMYKS